MFVCISWVEREEDFLTVLRVHVCYKQGTFWGRKGGVRVGLSPLSVSTSGDGAWGWERACSLSPVSICVIPKVTCAENLMLNVLEHFYSGIHPCTPGVCNVSAQHVVEKKGLGVLSNGLVYVLACHSSFIPQ